jgi:hypothetical protein
LPIFASSAPQRSAAAAGSVSALIASISALTAGSLYWARLKLPPAVMICRPSKIGIRNGPPDGQSAPQLCRDRPGWVAGLPVTSR